MRFRSRYLVPDDPKMIKDVLVRAIYEEKSDVIVLIGGTGVATEDVTVETISPLFEKRLYGFEHLFYMLSYMQVGADAMLSRVTAGRIGNSFVFLLPGSEKAVKLALSKLICPEITHLMHHARE